MAAGERSDDLAAMFASVARRLADAERPLLAGRGLTMWEYVVLSHLVRGPVPNQLTLAREVRHDKTRLIRVLDGLQERDLISRNPDPADRRSHAVSITAAGKRLHSAAQLAIRAMEDDVLSALTAGERRAVQTALPKLYAD